MARLTGFEPATSGVTGRHSNQLSYNRATRLRSRSAVARLTGLEPATSGVTGRHSNQLSYTRAFSGPRCGEPPLYARAKMGSSGELHAESAISFFPQPFLRHNAHVVCRHRLQGDQNEAHFTDTGRYFRPPPRCSPDRSVFRAEIGLQDADRKGRDKRAQS